MQISERCRAPRGWQRPRRIPRSQAGPKDTPPAPAGLSPRAAPAGCARLGERGIAPHLLLASFLRPTAGRGGNLGSPWVWPMRPFVPPAGRQQSQRAIPPHLLQPQQLSAFLSPLLLSAQPAENRITECDWQPFWLRG